MTMQISAADEHLLARVAIDALNQHYYFLIDRGHFAEAAELFTESGGLVLPGGALAVGRDAVRTYLVGRPTDLLTRHVSSNLHLVFEDAGHARGMRSLLFFCGEGPGPFPCEPVGLADCEEHYECGADGAWRYAYRRTTPLFGKGAKPRGPAPT